MFGKGKDNMPDELRSPAPVQQFHNVAAAPAAEPEAPNGASSISAGMTVTGKIAGSGAVKIFGRVQGELHASTVLIADGAEVEGDVVAEELTVGGRVKGTIRANRVRTQQQRPCRRRHLPSLAGDRGERAVRRDLTPRRQCNRQAACAGGSAAGQRSRIVCGVRAQAQRRAGERGAGHTGRGLKVARISRLASLRGANGSAQPKWPARSTS